MSNISQITESIINQGMLPLYFNADETVSVDVLKAIYRAGVKAVEYTNRGEAASINFVKFLKAASPRLVYSTAFTPAR